MKTIQKELPKGQVELEIEISSEEFDKYFDQTILDLAKNVEIEGFRKGKAPVEIVKQKIGEQKIIVEASETAVRESYLRAIEENKLEPISQPEIEIIKLARGNPLIFKAKFFIMPKIELPDYKKIISKIKKNKIKVEEKEVEDSLDWVRKSRAKFTPKDPLTTHSTDSGQGSGQAENGDFVEIEYWLSKAEDSNPPQKIEDAFILGEGHLLGDFEKELLGMKAGEEKEFFTEVPESHHDKNVAGKKMKIKAKLKSAQTAEFPELNDEFAKSLGDFANLEVLKENIKQGILHEKEHQESHKLRDEILSSIEKETKWDLPEFLVVSEQKRMLEDMKHNVSHNLKMNFDEYLKQIKKTEAEILDSCKLEAEKRVKDFIVLKNVEEKEEIKASEEEINEEINKTLSHYKNTKTAEEEIDLERLKSYTESVIKQEKTFKLLESFIK